MRLFKRTKEDEGASNTISFIVIMLFVMMLLVSFLDVGIYFNVKNEMRSAAEAGARNVALYGSTDGGLRDFRDSTSPEKIVMDSINDNYKETGQSKIVSVKEDDIVCKASETGNVSENAGDRVWCTISYEYIGIAGKYGMLQLGETDVVVEGTAVSEVGE